MNAVATMPECLIAPFRQRIGQEVAVNFPEGAETVRITEVDPQGDISAEKLIKAGGRTVATTPRNFKLSDLDPGERFKLLGRDGTPERQIMRGILAWEAEKTDAAKSFFAKANNDLGQLLVTHVDQVARDRRAAAAREQKAAQEAAAAKAYSAMLEIAGVESISKNSEKMITAIRRERFSKADVSQITRHLKKLTTELAKTKTVSDHQRVLKCFGLVRADYPLEVDQAVLDKALRKMNKDNPKEVIQATFRQEENGLSLTLQNLPSLTDISGLSGIPLTKLTIDRCPRLADLTPLAGMPLKDLEIKVVWQPGARDRLPMLLTDITPLQGMPLERLVLTQHRNLKDISPMKGMPLKHLNLWRTGVSDLSTLRGMPLESLEIRDTPVKDLRPLKDLPLTFLGVGGKVQDLSPIKGIKGLKLER